jgi:hypothetical protein
MRRHPAQRSFCRTSPTGRQLFPASTAQSVFGSRADLTLSNFLVRCERWVKSCQYCGPPVHIGTVLQGRNFRLCDNLGQQLVLASLSNWIQRVEKPKNTRGVASAQFWRGLPDTLGAAATKADQSCPPPLFQKGDRLRRQ